MCTVKPLNNGHIGGRALIHCREVVPISKVDIAGHTPMFKLINTKRCGLQEAEAANLDQTCSERAKNLMDKTEDWIDYLSNKRL